MKKNKKNNRKTVPNQQIREFWAIFNYRYKWIEAKNPYIDYEKGGFKWGKNGKLKPDWRRSTSKRPIRQKVLEHIYNDPTELIGQSFDKDTRFICFDIDTTSRYHFATNEPALREILGKLEQIGLVCPFFVRSSYSNGLHVFYTFKRGINSFNLACAAQEFLREQDIVVQSGTLEIFPNPKPHKKNIDESFFNGIKLPLQPNTGSVILDDNFEPIGNDLETFEKMMAFSAEKQDLETLEIACKKYGNKVRLQRCGRNSNSLKNFLKDLEKAIACGFTGKGQTNLLLLDIGCYGVVKERLDEEIGIQPLADYIKEIITNLNGYKEYCGHQHEIDKRCREVAKSCQEYYWAAGKPRKRNRKTYKDTFGRTLDRSINGNDAKTLRAIQKLEAAIANVQDRAVQGLLEVIPQNITAYKKLVIENSKQQFGSGISPSTLNKASNKTILKTAFHTFLAAVAAGQIAVAQPVEAAPAPVPTETVTTASNKPTINNPTEPNKETKPIPKQKINIKPILKSTQEKPTPAEQAQQSKIHLEKKLNPEPKTNTTPEKEIQQLIKPTPEPKKQSKPIIKLKPKTEPKTEAKTQPETQTKTPIKSTPKTAQSQSQSQKYTPCIKESKTETPKPAPRLESTHLALYVGFGHAHSPDLDFSFAFPEFSNLQNITKSYTQHPDANPLSGNKLDLSVTHSLQAFEAPSSLPESEPIQLKSSEQASPDLLDLEYLQQERRELSLHEIEPTEQQQERSTSSEAISKPEESTQTKRHTTPEQQAYYQELLKRHPHLSALEGHRDTPEYQTKATSFFERVRAILGADGKRNRKGLTDEADTDSFT